MRLPHGLTWRDDATPQHPEKNKQAPPAPGGSPQPGGGNPGEAKAETKQDGNQGGTGGTGQGNDACMTQLMMLVPMILIFWFLLIRPQQKQEKELKQMRESLRKGDLVILGSGLHAEVLEVKENTVIVQADRAGEIRLTYERSAIARVLRDEGTEAATDEQKS